MSSTDILLENILNQIAELREALTKHIEKEDGTIFTKRVEAFKGWIVPLGCVLVTIVGMLLGYKKDETKQPLDISTLKAVASSTLVVSKRIQAIDKEIEDKIK